MDIAADTIAKPKNKRGVLFVRILTWLALILFVAADLLVPRGITVFWSTYLLLFGPAILLDFAAVVGFVVCRLAHRKISYAYLLMCLAVMASVWYVTWFDLRLQWYKLLH